MDEHKECYNYVDILIHFKELKIAADKIKLIDPDFDTSFLEKQKEYLDKLMKLLEINTALNEQGEMSFSLINTMSKMTTVVENNDMTPAVFDNFGSGLANLLSGGLKGKPTQPQQPIPQPPSVPQPSQQPLQQPIPQQILTENTPLELTTLKGIKLGNVKLPKEMLERHFLIKK